MAHPVLRARAMVLAAAAAQVALAALAQAHLAEQAGLGHPTQELHMLAVVAVLAEVVNRQDREVPAAAVRAALQVVVMVSPDPQILEEAAAAALAQAAHQLT